jgi:sulfite reductase beta subunit-like hemoprotein
VTTRQDIELHNLSADNAVEVQRRLSDVGLRTVGAGGDSIRNITACSGCDLDSTSGDVAAAAQAVDERLRRMTFDLPRKFKISFSGCSVACAKPWLNDLGFLRQRDDLFTVIGAGSLGPKPALGIELYRDLPAEHVVPLCVAALEFFAEEADRVNRHRARFRHVRERMGDEVFRRELDRRFADVKASKEWPNVELQVRTQYRDVQLLWKLQLPNGDISAADAVELADIAEKADAELRINIEHGLELYGRKAFRLPEHLARLEGRAVVIACPGASTCSKGIINSQAAADSIRKALDKGDTSGVRVCISGCPNNCAHSAAAEIGFVGMKRKEGGEAVECLRVFVAGGNGCSERLADAKEVIGTGDVGAYVQSLLAHATAR